MNRFVFPVAFVAAAVFFLSVHTVRADEVTRRIQEELRKRNLFFGDVDGRPSAQLSAALHRYQERKGFSSTGETDTETLDSLNITLPAGSQPPRESVVTPTASIPPPLDARDGGVTNWPDITVLRSDEARPSPKPADLEAAAAAGEQAARKTPAPPPSAGSVLRRPPVEKVREYLTRYLQAGQNNDAADELQFYGDRVAYYDEGTVDHAYISRDVTRYDHRWPERHFTLLDPVTVSDSPDGDPDKFVVNFRYGFDVRNPHYTVAGKTDNVWTVSNQNPGGWKIVSMKEQRVREK